MTENLGQTPSQTVGPYYAMRIATGDEWRLPVPDGAERIVISGQVLDADDEAVPDALVETWQANPVGRYNHPDDQRDLTLHEEFSGFGRSRTESGEYRIETVKPGPVPDPEGEPQAPHISVIVQARGMLNPVFTRIYFSDEPEANEHDLVMQRVPKDRRDTLVAKHVEGSDPTEYHFDIKLQGDNETVFFDV